MRLFLKEADFEAFERTIETTLQTCPMRICSYCLLSNIGILCFGRSAMGTWARLCRNSRSRTYAIGRKIVVVSATVIFTRGVTNRFPWNRMTISIKSCVMSSGTRCGQMWWPELKTGVGQVFGAACMGKPRTEGGSAGGQCRVRELGWTWSTNLRRKRSWKRSVAASCEASHTEARGG